MPSIINGLFSGRSGIASHGVAIAAVGDNISNSSTVGYKASRAEFEDLVAGGQTSGKIVGSGSSTSSVSTVFEQGTLEFTSRPLDLAIDGNGFFVVAQGEQRFYTRAGNFKIDNAGYIVNQNDLSVLGYPADGTGALEPLNVNSISQASVASANVSVAGNLDASTEPITAAIPVVPVAGVATGNAVTYKDLNNLADFSSVVDIYDSLGAKHTVNLFYFHTASNQYSVRAYVNSEDVDPPGGDTGYPRLIQSADSPGNGIITLTFNGDGTRNNTPAADAYDLKTDVKFNNGSDNANVKITLAPFTQFSAPANILSIAQDGQGIGTVTSISVEKNGDIFALLSNGQSSTIGQIGMANFANPEGLTRIGGNLLQQSKASGEPVVGKPETGTFGGISSGSIELSTVDIANEFVKLITLQRGFQANSRIITTINQLLNDIIQLA